LLFYELFLLRRGIGSGPDLRRNAYFFRILEPPFRQQSVQYQDIFSFFLLQKVRTGRAGISRTIVSSDCTGVQSRNRSLISESLSRSQSRSKTVPEKTATVFQLQIDRRFPDHNRILIIIFKSTGD
jgi:hypothetical protein